MKNFKKIIFASIILAGVSVNAEQKACTREYKPVCASIEVQCLKAPCEPVKETFSNKCVMENNKLAKFLHEGECEKKTDGQVGMANPASEYCVKNGGRHTIKETKEGQIGMCVFQEDPNMIYATSCEEWAFYRGECKKIPILLEGWKWKKYDNKEIGIKFDYQDSDKNENEFVSKKQSDGSVGLFLKNVPEIVYIKIFDFDGKNIEKEIENKFMLKISEKNKKYCKLEKKEVNGKIQYKIEGNQEVYKKLVEKTNEIPENLCGDYEDYNSVKYFVYDKTNPNKYIFLSLGQDQPVFDQDSIELVNKETTEPTMCTMEYMPVCGVNGVTYGNKCGATFAKAKIKHEGACVGEKKFDLSAKKVGNEYIIASENNLLKIDAKFPIIGNKVSDKKIENFVNKYLNEFTKNLSSEIISSEWKNEVKVSYELVKVGENIATVKFEIYEFTGGAHGNTIIKTFNFNSKTGNEIKINNAKFIEKISEYAIKFFNDKLEKKEINTDKQWIKDGLIPTKEVYSNWLISKTENGNTQIKFYFPQYQIAPYSEGIQVLEVNTKDLK